MKLKLAMVIEGCPPSLLVLWAPSAPPSSATFFASGVLPILSGHRQVAVVGSTIGSMGAPGDPEAPFGTFMAGGSCTAGNDARRLPYMPRCP
jgi:hypothetical protein